MDLNKLYHYLLNRKELNRKYSYLINQLKSEHPNAIFKSDVEADRWLWIKSMAFSNGSLSDGLPWMPFVAIRKLERLLNKKSKVFEYGAGGSTIYFAARVGELVSVEHDENWLNKTIEAMLKFKNVKWKYFFGIPKIPTNKISGCTNDPKSYTTSDESLKGLSFYDYVSSIDNYPDQYFDVILIDGRSRPSCFEHSTKKIKSGGYIILDNAERAEYSEIEQKAINKGFDVEECWGPGPYNLYGWRTIFMKAK